MQHKRFYLALDSIKYQVAEVEILPPSMKGLEYPMVVLRTKKMKGEISLNNLVNHIIDKYAKDFATTVIYETIEDLTEENGKKKIMACDVVQGSEDEFIIYSISGKVQKMVPHIRFLDALTRARNGFVVVMDTDSRYLYFMSPSRDVGVWDR